MNLDKETIKALKETLTSTRRDGIWQISEMLIESYSIKTIGESKKEIYLYQAGVYVEGQSILEEDIRIILEELMNKSIVSEILGHIKAGTRAERKDFKVDKNFINFNNGVYDLEANKLRYHDPKYLFFHKLAVNYDPYAKCPMVDEFLNQILREDHVNIMKEWFGYVLYRDYFIKKALILTGEKNTGKTTALNIFASLIGRENTSGVSLHQIAGDKFSTAELYNKHLNLVDDLQADDIKSTGKFKMVTGKSGIGAEYKFGNRFQFQNFAKLTYACNKIPNVQDNDDDAYFERWIVIKFDRPVDKPDKFLLDRILTEEEKSGLLNQLLRHLNNLIANQEFTYKRDSEEIKADMIKSSSSVASFVYDCLKEEVGSIITKDDLHYYFGLYAKEENLPFEELKKFGKELLKHAKYITESRLGTQRTWNNIKLNDDYDEKYIRKLGNEKIIQSDEGGGDNDENEFFDEQSPTHYMDTKTGEILPVKPEESGDSGVGREPEESVEATQTQEQGQLAVVGDSSGHIQPDRKVEEADPLPNEPEPRSTSRFEDDKRDPDIRYH